jgi:SAM-dependent methyltransferase
MNNTNQIGIESKAVRSIDSTRLMFKIAKVRRVTWYRIRYLVERIRGIDTLKYANLDVIGLSGEEALRYEFSKKRILHKAVKAIKEIIPINTMAIIDIGCGKGKALIEFSKYPFRKVAGLEYSEELLNICKKNLDILRIFNVELLCMNAKDFINIDDVDIFYFYHPFPESVFRRVIDNMIDSIKRSNKTIYIMYKYPVYHELFTGSGYFTLIKKIEYKNKYFPHIDDVNIYKSITNQ